MTRRTGTARTSRPARDPYGLGPAQPYLAPAIATVALLIVGVMTLNLMNGQLPFRPGGNPGPGNQPDGAVRSSGRS